MKAIYAAFEKEFSEAYSPLGLNPEAGVEIEAFVLKASLPQPHPTSARRGRPGPRPRRSEGAGHRPALSLGDRRSASTPLCTRCRLLTWQRVRRAGADRIR